MDVFLDILNNFGFPVACVVALAYFGWKLIDRVMTEQQAREEKLYDELSQCREVNKQALETIAKYATKLDTIQTDVQDIKTDMIIVKSKIE